MDDYASDVRELLRQLDAAEAEARLLVAGLPDNVGSWHPSADSWSIAECLHHLSTSNTVYLRAMQEAACKARSERRIRVGPAQPGWVGGWFVKSLEPPVRRRFKAPQMILPLSTIRLDEAFAHFLASQDEVRKFLKTNADLDLARVRFKNPFLWFVRFSLATGLHVMTAHERRHLWQARQVKESAERSTRSTPSNQSV